MKEDIEEGDGADSVEEDEDTEISEKACTKVQTFSSSVYVDWASEPFEF